MAFERNTFYALFTLIFIRDPVCFCNSFRGINPPFGAYIGDGYVLTNVARSENGGNCSQYSTGTDCNRLIDGIFFSSGIGHMFVFGSFGPFHDLTSLKYKISFNGVYEITQVVIHKGPNAYFIEDIELNFGDSSVIITLSRNETIDYFTLDVPMMSTGIFFTIMSIYEGGRLQMVEVQILAKLREPFETPINVASTYCGGSCTGASSSGDSCSILIDDVIISERPYYWVSNTLHSLRFDFAKRVYIQQVAVELMASSLASSHEGIISFDSEIFTNLYFPSGVQHRFIYNLTAETTYMIFTLTPFTTITEIYVYGNFLQEAAITEPPITEALVPLLVIESATHDGQQLTTFDDLRLLETNTGTTATRNDDTSSTLASAITVNVGKNSQKLALGPEMMYGIMGSLGAIVLISLIVIIILIVRLRNMKFKSNTTNDIKMGELDVIQAQLNRNPTYDRPTNSKYETMVSADYASPYTALAETKQKFGGMSDGNVDNIPKYETIGTGDYTDPYTILSK